VEQADLLRHVIDALEKLNINYILVGSLASTLYGNPRMTQDIDIVIDLKEEQVPVFCSTFPSSDFYLSESAVRDAVRTHFQFNVLHPASGNKIDFMLAQDDAWGHQQLANRQLISLLPDCKGYAARPEDVILGKLRYYHEGRSEKHLRDIAGIIKLQGTQLDHEYVVEWAERLGVKQWWEMILERIDSNK
jgi:hypothetical protein